jgi:hypothetical protein
MQKSKDAMVGLSLNHQIEISFILLYLNNVNLIVLSNQKSEDYGNSKRIQGVCRQGQHA